MLDDKGRLRAALRSVAIPDDQRALASHLLADVVVNHAAFITATAITAFVGVRHEPDTTAILHTALEHGKQLFLPRVLDRTTLAWHRIHDLDALVTSAFGLLEPSPSHPHALDFPSVELAIIPGLAFASRSGARLGQGRGYYDRALQHAPTRTTFLGVCLARFLDPPEGEIPTTPTDVLMHAVATERGLLPIR